MTASDLSGEETARRRSRKVSNRALIVTQYRQALKEAFEVGKALIIDLDKGERAPTVANRVAEGVLQLGVDDVVIHRRGRRIVAYREAHAGHPE